MGIFSDMSKLGQSILDSLSGLSENEPTTLDGLLGGSFLSKIDQTAERQYVGSGYVRNIRPREMQTLLQEPDVTVVIKKRMFASLSENFKPELMDDAEKLFYRASKKLFDNKCKMIAAYEQLTKMDRIVEAAGAIDQTMVPLVFSALDSLESFGVSPNAKAKGILEQVKKAAALGNPNYRTTWVKTDDMPSRNNLGEGTGVMELTNVTTISCTVSTIFNQGSGTLTIEDPNKMMIITTGEIENAIRQCTAGFTNNIFFKFTETQLNQATESLKKQLDDIRRARGASKIIFNTQPNTLLQHKIRAFIDEEGREINFSLAGGVAGFGSELTIDAAATQGFNGLRNTSSRNNTTDATSFFTSTSELDLFSQIIKNMYQLLALKVNTEVTDIKFNKETNAVRRKMFLHYANKPIIQPMDVVHFFISSKTALDPRTALNLGKALAGEDIISSMENTIEGINSLVDNYGGKNRVGENIISEKNAIAGPDMPTWIWNMMRNDFTRQAAGTHVFAGIVISASHSYDGSGKYTLNVNATDNAGYFNMGRININPAQTIFNGDLYDPLTPFDLEFDPGTGFIRGEFPPLLKENLNLLTSKSVRFKNGSNLGLPASQQSWQAGDIESLKTQKASPFRLKLDDPDGFVYRWKEGIQSKTFLGKPYPSSSLDSVNGSTQIAKKPFAGQDSMNVISLLVTGQPYNFNTFMKSAIQFGGYTTDELNNAPGAKSFFRSLISDISMSNSIWGNFIPFKKLIMNNDAYNFIVNQQKSAIDAENKISALLKERATKFDALTQQISSNATNPLANNPQLLSPTNIGSLNFTDKYGSLVSSADASIKLGADIITLDAEISKYKKQYQDAVSANLNNGGIRIYGDDISYDPAYVKNKSSSEGDLQAQRIELRKKINNLTQRRLWKVKGNIDDNLFIVDDTYDKNFDIMAFEKSLQGNLELFNSTYTTIGEQISTVSKILGLEVFADTQGHIQARPPQYNRMPSSVFSNMIDEKEVSGIQIFPPYLESLLVSQVKGLADTIEVIEDKIRLYATAIGYVGTYGSDSNIQTLLKSSIANSEGNFIFLTSPSTGRFGGQIQALLDKANPDLYEDENMAAGLKELTDNTLSKVLKTKSNFDLIKRINVANELSNYGASEDDGSVKTEFDRISARLLDKTGEKINLQDVIDLDKSANRSLGLSQLDVVNVTSKISQLINERQTIIQLLSRSLTNLVDGIEVNSDYDKGKAVLYPELNKKKGIPTILEHMIEDEETDDLGFGSGKRYIIRDEQIRSITVKEEPPKYTMVEVNGLYGEGLADPPGDQNAGGGNFQTTAWAVDYDMCRMYGYREQNAVNAPYLSNPETQCAPFAVFWLNRARADIFQGEVTIVGNEFIQPGEVYFIEDYNLLFYAESISHSFSYGGEFSTRMTLKYGHNPGEYVPTILDVVGRSLYTNRHQSELVRHNRHGYADGSTPIATIIYDPNVNGNTDVENLVKGDFGQRNRSSLANMILATSGSLTRNYGKNKKAKIQLRVYYDDTKSLNKGAKPFKLAGAIKQWLSNPVLPDADGKLVPMTDVKSIDTDNITIVEINLGDMTEHRSPSADAWNVSRELMAGNYVQISNPDKNPEAFRTPLVEMNGCVVDIWLGFDDISETKEAKANPTDQKAASDTQRAIQAFTDKVNSFVRENS